ncbi:uncharacterized protein involved in copper resistance [Pedobacter cryoconitis]|uniref:Uncharacterized protein involved in copper resistance n=2 Tax=Pedobacter cryoconitis TaxID=188932 RepID=A0A7X0MLJ7_9SPHI|nr:uncharacterized protein involved in copper resistance [Pedobacter cryoconitis]
MKTQNLRSNLKKGIMAAVITFCFAITTQTKAAEHPLQKDTTKMASSKMSKMSKGKMSSKKMDKMAPSKMSKSKMNTKKVDKMAPSKM